jgi:hypothetical protein
VTIWTAKVTSLALTIILSRKKNVLKENTSVRKLMIARTNARPVVRILVTSQAVAAHAPKPVKILKSPITANSTVTTAQTRR